MQDDMWYFWEIYINVLDGFLAALRTHEEHLWPYGSDNVHLIDRSGRIYRGHDGMQLIEEMVPIEED